MRFVTVLGARPQFIKAAPLALVLRARHEEILVHTGQHYDDNMSAVFFRELGIPEPDRHLGVGSGPQGAQTAAMLQRVEQVLLEMRPDAVIVFGDTNSTLAGALAAAKLGIPVAHVEAGLRSFVRDMPEEINRVLTDRLARWLFTPSAAAQRQLAREGIERGVFDVGDIMADAVRQWRARAAEQSTVLGRLGLEPGQYALATVHRAANTDCAQRLASLLAALANLGRPVVFPVHPRTRAAIVRSGLEGAIRDAGTGLRPIEPLGYLDMIQLQQLAEVVLTDSGGMQKEAYYLGVPCVTLRDETEWLETVEVGWNRLAGVDPGAIRAAVNAFGRSRPAEHPPLYGDGHAAERIVQILSDGA